jgi:hypothetical protein
MMTMRRRQQQQIKNPLSWECERDWLQTLKAQRNNRWYIVRLLIVPSDLLYSH